jgi:hypothetical protein
MAASDDGTLLEMSRSISEAASYRRFEAAPVKCAKVKESQSGQIRKLEIRNFRGVSQLEWNLPKAHIFCLIGKGVGADAVLAQAADFQCPKCCLRKSAKILRSAGCLGRSMNSDSLGQNRISADNRHDLSVECTHQANFSSQRPGFRSSESIGRDGGLPVFS